MLLIIVAKKQLASMITRSATKHRSMWRNTDYSPQKKQPMRNEWKPKHPFRQPTKLLVIGSTNVQAHSPVNYQCATVLTIMAKRLEESHFMVPSRTGATRKNKVPRMFYGVQNTTTANRSTNFENVRRFREQKC